MKAVKCSDCALWDSKSGQVGWCHLIEREGGKCSDGIRFLPATMAKDGCVFGWEQKRTQDIAK